MTELRQKLIKEIRLRGYTASTERAYLAAVKGLVRHYGKSPEQITRDEIERYLLHIRDERGFAFGTCNQIVNALLFFYKHTLQDPERMAAIPLRKSRKHLPEVLSREEVIQLINAPDNLKHRVLLLTTYSAGLRVSEVVTLKVSNIDSKRGLIRVEQGKGYKDRYTVLSEKLLEELRTYYKAYRPKTYLFPRRQSDKPLDISTASKIYRAAKKKAGITRGKGIHTLRHCFASHLLESGSDIHIIQRLLGHRQLATTLVYLHVSKKNLMQVKSPLDFVATSEEAGGRPQ